MSTNSFLETTRDANPPVVVGGDDDDTFAAAGTEATKQGTHRSILPYNRNDMPIVATNSSSSSSGGGNHDTTATVQLTFAQLEKLLAQDRRAIETKMELRLKKERRTYEELFQQQQQDVEERITSRAKTMVQSILQQQQNEIFDNNESTTTTTTRLGSNWKEEERTTQEEHGRVGISNAKEEGAHQQKGMLVSNGDQFLVRYCDYQGHLLVSSDNLQFISNDGTISMMWAWKSLGTITTTNNRSTTMRIGNLVDPTTQERGDLEFQFDTNDSVSFAAVIFQRYIREAKSMTAKEQTIRKEFCNKGSTRNAAAAPPPAPAAKQGGRHLLLQDSTNTELTQFWDSESLQSSQPQIQTMERSSTTVGVAKTEIDVAFPKITGAIKPEEAKSLVINTTLPLAQPQEDDDDGYDDWHSPFGESVYTLLYMCEFQSQGFWYGIFVYGIQLATIGLTLGDVTDVHYTVPPMVDLTVTFAQAITIFMLVAYMSDLIEAVQKLQIGFYPEVLLDHPGATYATWLISCLAQLSAGLLLLVASFALTMQSKTVIELMLNLTALLFMAEIDDIGFAMAKMGFVTDQLQKEAQNVANFKVPKQHQRNGCNRVLYFSAVLGLITGYGLIKDRQMGGYYLPTHLYVQFGDAYSAKHSYYSGLLICDQERTLIHRKYHDPTEKIFLSYCVAEKAWTFSEGSDPCDYFAKSYETYAYDVTSLHSSEWEVMDSFGRLQPFDSFTLVSQDCNAKTCQGTCKEGLCECSHDRFGFDCEFDSDSACPNLRLNGNLGSFPLVDYLYVAPELEVLKDDTTGTDQYVKFNNFPIYHATEEATTIIFFAGRRWIITKFLMEEDSNTSSVAERAAAVFKEDFHGYHNANYTPLFFSDPVDFGTPDYHPTPSGLGWWSANVLNRTSRNFVPGLSVDAEYICETCYDSKADICGGHGTCNQGVCVCDYGYEGGNCETEMACYDIDNPCGGVGHCDQLSGICSCNSPWTGKKSCDIFVDCDQEEGQCQNGGTCINGICACPKDDPALTGYACETFLDCHIHGCAHGGVCLLSGQCICRPPFAGILCNLVDETLQEYFCLVDNDCANGTCDNNTGVCDCDDPASFGTLCELQYNCSWGGCLNSGSCNESTGVCDCQHPFFGPDCSREPTCFDDSYCAVTYGPGSSCNNRTGGCQCGLNMWEGTGKKCDTCKTEGCHNNGVCNEYGFCECPIPYTGRFCDYLAEDVGPSSDVVNKTLACIETHGFPPYNGTDCRHQDHGPYDDDW